MLAVVPALSAFACGAADRAPTPEPIASADPTEVQSGVNVCPRFDGSLVMPQRIAPNEASVITVSATDPDAPDSLLVFSWSAASGTFSASDKPVTVYHCTRVGAEQLTVVARDRRGCTTELTIDVECVAN
ncbi:MAG TPA: hypothetical protein VHM25_05755 [Polyangiaceae bacterium]|jgi:hypothetical protein|nr:hypothetical protein [Polyangiaceae bacterium]